MADPLAELRSDALRGASELLRKGARALRDHAEDGKVRSRVAFVRSMAKMALLVADAQPAMAPFVHLADAAVKAAESGEDLAAARVATAASIDAFVEAAEADREQVARRAARLVRAGSVVLVYSRSSTVERALLLAAAEGKRFTVLCPEARPNMEGRILARNLARAGIPVDAFVDAAAFSVASRADMLLLGADALVPVGLINKVGTSGLALLAQGAGVPVYCVAGRTKMLPSADLIDPHREGEHLAEVWGGCPAGVRVVDRYYDLTRLEAVRGFVLEDGVLGPEDLRGRLAAIRLHPAVLASRRKPGTRTRARARKKS
jgi:translation initiation factor 2B subunit (eIF-2B alpha/beta/delta family)